MKKSKFSIVLLCMSLAGCSLPFFSGQKASEDVVSDDVVEIIEEKAAVDDIKEVDVEEERKEKETAAKVSFFGDLVKTVQANLFDENEVDTGLGEENFKETIGTDLDVLEVDDVFVDNVIFIEPDILPEPEIEEEYFLIEDSLVVDPLEEGVVSPEDLQIEELEKLMRETAREIKENQEEEMIEIEEAIPAGALPSTGAASPLASLWGWVKSWF